MPFALNSLALGSSEDKASPAAEVSQPADVAERSPKERPSPPHSPADKPISRRSASSSSERSSSNSSEDEDDDGEHNGTQRKIKSSVAQIRVSIRCHFCITLTKKSIDLFKTVLQAKTIKSV